jgi:hypothetical protein
VVKLLGYHYDIQYKPGKQNMVADALSRSFGHDTVEFKVLSVPHFSFLNTFKQELLLNPSFLDLSARNS